MPQVATLSAMTALSLIGATLGVHLGQAAIAEIDPIYFGPPPQRYFADLTPAGYQMDAWQASKTADYWAGDPEVASTSACRDCAPNAIDQLYVAANEPSFAAPATSLPQPRKSVRNLSPGELDRYMSFPVTEDEANQTARGMSNPTYAQGYPSEIGEPQPEGM